MHCLLHVDERGVTNWTIGTDLREMAERRWGMVPTDGSNGQKIALEVIKIAQFPELIQPKMYLSDGWLLLTE